MIWNRLCNQRGLDAIAALAFTLVGPGLSWLLSSRLAFPDRMMGAATAGVAAGLLAIGLSHVGRRRSTRQGGDGAPRWTRKVFGVSCVVVVLWIAVFAGARLVYGGVETRCAVLDAALTDWLSPTGPLSKTPWRRAVPARAFLSGRNLPADYAPRLFGPPVTVFYGDVGDVDLKPGDVCIRVSSIRVEGHRQFVVSFMQNRPDEISTEYVAYAVRWRGGMWIAEYRGGVSG